MVLTFKEGEKTTSHSSRPFWHQTQQKIVLLAHSVLYHHHALCWGWEVLCLATILRKLGDVKLTKHCLFQRYLIFESAQEVKMWKPIHITGTPPLTRFFGPLKNCVKGKPCYRRSILVLKMGNGTFSFPKSPF